MYILAVIEHGTRRIRILGATVHPATNWVTQAARNACLEPAADDVLRLDIDYHAGRAALLPSLDRWVYREIRDLLRCLGLGRDLPD